MNLTAGTRLGPYEIVSPLGAGGMGEVYRARDTRLDRTVAIKVLSDADPDLKARFEREAKSIAALQHPHICTLHDVGDHEGTQYLVMEHLEGETLAARLEGLRAKDSRLPVAEALRIAIEIASALDAAHRAGIVHRDLKPGNVMLTKSGAKLLDFGLAKLRPSGALIGSVRLQPDVTAPPTLSAPITGHGMILGTLQYMSPEQLEGHDADARSDIFAFGAVLYEMVTGRRAFEGKSQASLIAAILRVDPPAMATLQPITPPALERIVTTCLAKDPDDRWQTARDLMRELKWIADGTTTAAAGSKPGSARGSRPAWAVSAVLALVALAAGLVAVRHVRETPAPLRQPTRFAVTVSPTTPLFTGAGGPDLALSPDGTRLVYVAGVSPETQLYLRGMDQLDALPIRDTQGAASPFFSPDGQWVGFFADQKLKKISIAGGAAQMLTPTAGNGRSETASWGDDNTIVFSTSRGVIQRISAAGGKPQQLTTIDSKEGETLQRWPELLPGSKAVLFTSQSGNTQQRVMVHLPSTGETRVLDPNGSNPHYLPSGHLVFGRSGALLAAPFDLSQLRVTGPAVPIIEGIATSGIGNATQAALAANGSVAYVPGRDFLTTRTLTWVDRQGGVQPVIQSPMAFREARLSPDGQRIAIGIDGSPRDLWTYEINRGTLMRFTVEPSESEFAAWAPDGKRIAFGALRPKQGSGVIWKLADGSGAEERLLAGGPQDHYHPASWSPDGRLLAFTNNSLTDTVADIWILSLDTRAAKPFVKSHFNERAPMFSPDGRWIAYVSDESGRDQIYVQPYPGPGGKQQVSTSGGREPIWARNGRELFYRIGEKMMVVSVTTEPTFSVGVPSMLFEGQFDRPLANFPNFDVSPDGQRFLMFKGTQAIAPAEITVVLDWTTELARRVPAKP